MKGKRKLANATIKDVNARMVFVIENLTKSSRIFFSHARILRKENGWKYTWEKMESSELKKFDNSPAITLSCKEDLKTVPT